jgi:cyclopropane-fatty-acyl-phospholipid synthase
MESFARKTLLKSLAGLRQGHLELVIGTETHAFGDPTSDVKACIAVHNERFFGRVLFGGEDGAGDAYVDGDWSSPDLVAVIRLAVRNLQTLQSGNAVTSWLSRMLNRLRHLKRDNTIEGSRRNIHEHYDLSNEFFALFLDEKRVYSSAIFASTDTSLEDAQVEKIDRLCRKLRLQPGESVLEIGTGWGALAMHAAEHYGVHVTTTTISQQQHAYVEQLLKDTPPKRGSIKLLFEDYRKLQGQFEKIASIEMFEAVGLDHYDEFFGACDRLLAAQGVMAMQAITFNERGFDHYRKSADWIQRRIFPGSELASIKEIIVSLGRATKMNLYEMEDIGLHYAFTLAEWRRRFHERINEVRALGFDEPFLRSWDYYLAYCEGGFRERYISDVQVVLSKDGNGAAIHTEPWQSTGDPARAAVRSLQER